MVVNFCEKIVSFVVFYFSVAMKILWITCQTRATLLRIYQVKMVCEQRFGLEFSLCTLIIFNVSFLHVIISYVTNGKAVDITVIKN